MKEAILTRRAELISAIIGVVIGSVIGAIMSVSYWNETMELKELREENKTLREIVWQQESFIEQQSLQK
jgi:hypothetical protein